MLQPTFQMESTRSSTQTITTTFCNVLENFVQLALVEAIKFRIDSRVLNNVVHNFLRISQSTFHMLQSTVQLESSRSSYQTIRTTSPKVVETFVSLQFVESTKNRIDLLV